MDKRCGACDYNFIYFKQKAIATYLGIQTNDVTIIIASKNEKDRTIMSLGDIAPGQKHTCQKEAADDTSE